MLYHWTSQCNTKQTSTWWQNANKDNAKQGNRLHAEEKLKAKENLYSYQLKNVAPLEKSCDARGIISQKASDKLYNRKKIFIIRPENNC